MIEKSDIPFLNKAVPKAKCIYTKNKDIIKEFKNMRFIYTGSDIATVDSKIYIYDGNKLVFESGIILDEKADGMQNGIYGFMESSKGCG